MTIVVADSSPLNYLTLVGEVEVLHQLYGTIIVPQQVITELADPAAPRQVRDWASYLPSWVDVRVTLVDDVGMLLIWASVRRSRSQNRKLAPCY
jgi:predicted nucleic acid-binding protein